MLSPRYLSGVADSVISLYAEVELDLISDIVRRMIKTGRVTETAAWQIEKGKEFGLLSTEIAATLNSATNMSAEEIDAIIMEAAQKGISYDDKIYRAAGLNPVPLSESPAALATVLQGRDSTLMLLDNFTKTTAQNAQHAFIRLIDKAFLQTISGTTDYSTAINMAIKELVAKGINKIAYPNDGPVIGVEAAVRRNVLTGINQAVSKLQLERAEEMECTLVETTSHAGARPSHAVWQGKVFCIKGHHKHYGNFYKETGYGTGEGLCGWNCYHNFFPFFEGLSMPSFSHDPAADAGRDNDEQYENEQKMRYYERQVRNAKKECIAFSTAMDAATTDEDYNMSKDSLISAKRKLLNRERRLREFVKENDITKDTTRLFVGGWDRNAILNKAKA